MSLKALHVIFIAASILFSLGFGWYGISEYGDAGSFEYLIMGILSLVAGAGLCFYGVRFLQKLKHISYL